MANFLYWDYVTWCFYGLFSVGIVLLSLKQILKKLRHSSKVHLTTGLNSSTSLSGSGTSPLTPTLQNGGNIDINRSSIGKNYEYDREYDFERY